MKKSAALLFLDCALAGCGKEYSSSSVDKPIRHVWDEAVEAFARADLYVTTTEIDSSAY